MNNICCIFNYPPHYRENIYSVMDNNLPCDFYFGKNVPGELKDMDCFQLRGFKYKFKNIIFRGRIIWQHHILKLLFEKKYKNYILSVDTACLSEWMFLYMAKLLGKNVFLWTHGWYGNEKVLEKLKKKAFFYPAKRLLLYSNYARELMIKEGFSEEKLLVIANSLNYDIQKAIRIKLTPNDVYTNHFKNNYPTIIFIGRLEPKKKLDSILSCVKELVNINCVFVGDGSENENLQNQTKQLNLDERVWFYGACYDEKEIAQLIYNADVCLSPGNVGLTAIHALSFGTPVITHDNFYHQMPEFEAIINGKNGTFFKENDNVDMIVTIKNWLKEHPQKSQELIEQCYNAIDKKYNPYYQLQIIKQAIND